MIDIFVISPYSHEDPEVVDRRVHQAETYIAELVNQGIVAYSTIASMAHMIKNHNLRSDWEYWQDHCIRMIENSEKVHVLKLDGYEDSIGVRDELLLATKLGKEVVYIDVPGQPDMVWWLDEDERQNVLDNFWTMLQQCEMAAMTDEDAVLKHWVQEWYILWNRIYQTDLTPRWV